MKGIKFDFQKLNRRVHLYAGLIMIPNIFIFGVSGFLFNHPTLLIDRSVQSFEINEEGNFRAIFSNIEPLAASIITDDLISNPIIENVKYTNSILWWYFK